MHKDFEELVKEVRDKNYITIHKGKMLLSYDNVQKIKDAGFEINEKIIDRLMDELHDEKLDDYALSLLSQNNTAKNLLSKIVETIIQISLLILLGLLIYYLVPSFQNTSQEKDESMLYQNNYR